jgi:16S rRNA (cytidine1402-2'-O)-methyltransferase
MTNERGTLYVVGTPIGNLEDITLRALRMLRECGVIAAEDTRHTRKLLQRHEIETSLTSYHQHSGETKLRELVRMLESGRDVALVSDAGMPGFSDPGAKLVAACVEANIPVTVIPGPTASSAALAISGFSGREHHFLGFLSAKRGERREALARVGQQRAAPVCYEAPHRLDRLVDSLEDMAAVLGDREAVCARELTKRFEEVKRGTLSELATHFAEVEPRGEFTVVVRGAADNVEIHITEAVGEVQDLVKAGLSQRSAIAHVAKWRDVSRNTLYRAVHDRKETT